jgi:hypothetical protein
MDFNTFKEKAKQIRLKKRSVLKVALIVIGAIIVIEE